MGRPYAACKGLFEVSADRSTLTSKANGREFHIGRFGTPSVSGCGVGGAGGVGGGGEKRARSELESRRS